MTKAQRLKAMAAVMQACQRIKDKKPLAEAVRKIVDDLMKEQRASKEVSRAEHAANLAKKQASAPPEQPLQ